MNQVNAYTKNSCHVNILISLKKYLSMACLHLIKFAPIFSMIGNEINVLIEI